MSFSPFPVSKNNFPSVMSTNVCFNGHNISMMSFSPWTPEYIFIPLELFSSQVLFPWSCIAQSNVDIFLILTLASYGPLVCNILQLFRFFGALPWNSLQSQEKQCWCFSLLKNCGGWKQHLIKWLHCSLSCLLRQAWGHNRVRTQPLKT